MITARTLGDETAQRVREHIVYGTYAPGERLSEVEVAQVLAVSRTCVREAFAILEAEGLLRRVRNRFTEVVRFSAQDAREVMQLRAAIEKICAHTLVATRKLPHELLEQHLDGISRAVLAQPVDRRGYVEHDLGFHRALVLAAENRHALRHWSLLEAQVQTMLFLVLEDLDVTPETTIDLHRELLEILNSGTPDAAAQAVYDHGIGIIPCLEQSLEKETAP